MLAKQPNQYLKPNTYNYSIQRQGSLEHFQDTCGGVIGWLDSISYYTAFTEGWALYAENPLISNDTDVYDEEPMRKYGMLKWQASITLKRHLSFVAAQQPAWLFAFCVPRQFLQN